MSGHFYFTRKGFEALKAEIQRLENNLQELQIQVAHVAEVGGDQYHDNASYELLDIDIRGADKRLSDAHRVINNARIIDNATSSDYVAIGTVVTILIDGEREQRWIIGGYGESDPKKQIIAYNAPLAKIIMRKRKGDEVRGLIAGKEASIEIIDIELLREGL